MEEEKVVQVSGWMKMGELLLDATIVFGLINGLAHFYHKKNKSKAMIF